jgi:uncharacterized protein (TIGR02246 family)
MKMARKILIILLLSVCFVGSGSAQSRDPKTIVDDFVKAWNTHDMKAFDRLFTNEAIWVPVAEVRDEGRINIVKDLAEAHATWAKTTTVVPSTMKIRLLRPDIAVLLFHLKYVENGKQVPGIDRAMLIVAVKESAGWKIAAGQITKQSSK